MKIIKLSQKAVLSRRVDQPWEYEESVVYEPIYVVAEHIESFSCSGNTHLKMVSGDRIEVSETIEQVIEMLGIKPESDPLEIWDLLGKRE